MTTKGPVAIAPADGKLGVLLPGIGAVSTTFIAGVEAVKRGLGAPIGSLTQLATVRLGKRTEGRTPLIKDFVPLAKLEDLEFGGWDIYEDNAYEAALNAACSIAGSSSSCASRWKNFIRWMQFSIRTTCATSTAPI